MGAIPTSDMPGHRRLRERVYAALDRCQETQDVDFKESSEWANLKWRLIKTIMGMANLRDGGIVVIGAAERNETWDLTGIDSEQLSTYSVDDVVDTVNKHASPAFNVEVVRVQYRNSKEFLAIQIPEFELTPCVCKKASTRDGKYFQPGDVFVRPPGIARTTKVMNAQQMTDLLVLAGEKRARWLIEGAHRIGFVPGQSVAEDFDRELDGL